MDNIEIDELGLYLNYFVFDYKNKAGIFLCQSGSADFLINNQIYHINNGMLFIISPLIVVHIISQSDDFHGIHITDDLEVFYVIIHSMFSTILNLKLRDNPCMLLDKEGITYIINQKERIEKKRKDALSCSEEEKTIIHKLVQLLEQETLLEIITIYFKTKEVESHPLEKQESIVYSFISSLHINFKTERSVTFYANEAQLSTGYFTNIIKQKTGKTPSEWITTMTIVQAKVLLEKTQKSIKEIANELNFPEQFTFRKYFKQYVGIPPKLYRLEVIKREK